MQFFWGIVLLFLGLQIILESAFGVSIPFLKLFIGCFLIYLGFQILGIDTFFLEKRIHNDYQTKVIYGTTETNQSKTFFQNTHWYLNNITHNTHLYNKTTFGQTVFFINPSQSIRIKIKGFFSTIIVPGRKESLTLNQKFIWNNIGHDHTPMITVKAAVTFGTIKLVYLTEDDKNKEG
ncbi:hypothetical protein IPH25_04490 [bacterium]|nr:MAG: hypothetical protein IPG37_01485 [bacterium]QQR61702.1 MAG: hypothetical protein IPH25_04490 [bacterium]QQR62730.1 MAG: hypothetical protein IPH67_04945 [bacterium]